MCSTEPSYSKAAVSRYVSAVLYGMEVLTNVHDHLIARAHAQWHHAESIVRHTVHAG